MRKQVGAAFNLQLFLDKFPTAYELSNKGAKPLKITYSH